MATLFHRIKANLYDNYLTENPNDFAARVISERTLNISEICQAAVSRGSADGTPQEMEHKVKLFLKEMAYQLCDGYSVNTGYFTAGAQIRGVFDSATEQFNPEKHSINFLFNQGDLLRKEIPGIQVEILGVADSSLFIAQVTDVKTGAINDIITPNRNLKINGSKLKIQGNSTTGIYFINQASQERIIIDPTDIVTNNPSEIIIIVPPLTAGTYKLQITTQFSGNVPLKEPRTTTFDKILTVQ